MMKKILELVVLVEIERGRGYLSLGLEKRGNGCCPNTVRKDNFILLLLVEQWFQPVVQ